LNLILNNILYKNYILLNTKPQNKLITDLTNGNLRILVTGGAGFIGGCLIRKLLSNTNALIYNLDKITYASDLSWLENNKNRDRHHFIKADLVNFEETKNALQNSNPDLIVHLAAESHVDRSIENARPFIESNILGTFNLLENSKNHWDNLNFSRKNRFKFLHVSTDEVFGSLGKYGLFDENSLYDPRSPYSATKASSDHLVNAWFHTFNFPILKTNCSNNFGPYQFPEKLIPLIILKALNNEKIPIYGNGLNIRDWLFVEDHIDALYLVLEQAEIGKNYCIGGNNERSNIEIANLICEQLDLKFPNNKPHNKLIEFVEDRPGHDKRYAINSGLIQKELSWIPKYTFKDSIEKTIDWYIKNLNWCKKIQNNSNFKGERLGLN
tara:strand:- start:722 stop:1867 length:1146 start_codon:yes stop_codon:yes gene_type:complete